MVSMSIRSFFCLIVVCYNKQMLSIGGTYFEDLQKWKLARLNMITCKVVSLVPDT